MAGTGMRIGETTGLRWCDIDLDEGIIDVNHTLVYYNHRNGDYRKGNYFGINSPKTKAGRRQVPMLDFVKEVFLMEKTNQDTLGHQDITTTMNIYADVTKDLKQSEFEGLDKYFRRGSGIPADENEDEGNT